MGRHELTDEQFTRIEPMLPVNTGRGRRFEDHRRAINGVLFRLRTGIPWRDLPGRYGPWQSVFDRFNRWRRDGTWLRILGHLQTELDEAGQLDWSLFSIILPS